MGKYNIMMQDSEIDFIEGYLNKEQTMLEWGSGWSTARFSTLVKKYYSIEHDKEWYNKMSEEIKKEKLDNITYRHIEITTPIEDLYEIDPEYVKQYSEELIIDGLERQYQEYIDEVDNLGVDKFDVVLIDGRARNYCLGKVIPYLHEDSHVFIHDWHRKEYKENEFLKFFTITRFKTDIVKLKLNHG